MLEPKEVVGRARKHLADIMPEFAELDPKVEEIRLGQDALGNARWWITFSAHLENSGEPNSLADLVKRRRIEKVVSIAPDSGSLISIDNPEY